MTPREAAKAFVRYETDPKQHLPGYLDVLALSRAYLESLQKIEILERKVSLLETNQRDKINFT